MNSITRFILFLVLSAFLVCAASCHKKGGASNPYLHMKTKPSEKQNKENQKVIKKGNKAYRKKEESSRKHLFGRKHAPKK